MDSSVTVRDIAQASGVHFTTVALALRNSPKVAASTRIKVQEAARKLGYRPNPLVSALMAQKRAHKKPVYSSILAYITFNNPKDSSKKSWHEDEYIRGAHERCIEMGYRLEPFNLLETGMSASRLAQILKTRAISGLMLGSAKRNKGHLPRSLHEFSSIALSYSLARPALHRIAHHHYQGSSLACRQLRRKGYRRIGLVLTTLMDNQMDRLWTGGYLTFHEHLPAASRPKPLYLPKNEFPHALLRQWVLKEKPDVILTMHLQIKEWFDQNRDSFHHPIDLATLDYSPDWGDCYGIDQKPRLMGREAASFLVNQLQNNIHGLPSNPMTLVINGEWRPRLADGTG
jgi:DNA-binding LacI/PurR family transcriptional regulator